MSEMTGQLSHVATRPAMRQTVLMIRSLQQHQTTVSSINR